MMANAPLPEVTRPTLPATSSARMTTEPSGAVLDSLSVTLARLGAANPITHPPAQTVNPPEAVPTDTPPEAGKELPAISGIQWERKKDGALEAWHSPDGNRNRAGKTYIGRIGKRQLVEWEREDAATFRQLLVAWVAEKKAAKGI